MSGFCPLDKGRTSCPQRLSSLVPPTSSRVPKKLSTQGSALIPEASIPQGHRGSWGSCCRTEAVAKISYNTGSGPNSAQPPAWLLYPEEGARVTTAQSWDPRHLSLKDRTNTNLLQVTLCTPGGERGYRTGPCGHLSTWPHMHGQGRSEPSETEGQNETQLRR